MVNKTEYTCIFGGGAIRGFSYIGTIKYFEEIGLKPKLLVGSSVGSLMTTLFAMGYSWKELTEQVDEINFELFKDLQIGFFSEIGISKGDIYEDWVRKFIEQKFYGENYQKNGNPPVTFKDVEQDLIIITTDLDNFKYKEFSKFETPDFEIAKAVRISSAMPGLMIPVTLGDSRLVDGDLLRSSPAWKLSKNIYPTENRILEFRLEGEFESSKTKNPMEFLNVVYSCTTSISTDLMIDNYGQKDKFDYIKINTGELLLVDFTLSKEAKRELIDLGYRQTAKYFKTNLVAKKKNLINDYWRLLKGARDLEHALAKNQISKLKEIFGFYLLEVEKLENIDERFVNQIEEIGFLIKEKLSKPNFIGRYAERDVNLVQRVFKRFVIEVEDRIKELKEYIKSC